MHQAEHSPIDRLWPDPQVGLDDDALLATYAFPEGRAWLRMNFISSLDGAATRDGVTGQLGDAADLRVFDLLRQPADVVLVAAGTVRNEGYGAVRLGEEAVRWRVAQGLPPQPVFALASRTLALDPASSVFANAPVRPIVYTVDAAPAAQRAALSEVADVVSVGATDVDPVRMRGDLAARGLHRIHSEGGPRLFGSLLAAGAVDELCLTLAPTVDGGDATRIAHGDRAAPTGMELVAVLRAGSELLVRYRRGPQ